MARLSEFIALPLAKKRIVFEAFLRLCHAWMLVRFRPFSSWKARLGTLTQGEGTMEEIEVTPEIRSIRKAINQINRVLGGPFTCLMVAMAAKDMLQRRDVRSMLVLGASTSAQNENTGMQAHAWIYIGSEVLLGDEEREKYTAVARYTS